MPRSDAGREPLTRKVVVQAAAQLVNSEGQQALTVNRLARELGVRPPSLYNHIESLADLWRELALLSTQALEKRLMHAAVGKSGISAVMALAEAYRAYIKEFPGLYLASLPASGTLDTPDPRLTAVEDRIVQISFAVIESYGLNSQEAIHAVRALRSAIHGFTTLEIANGFGIPLDLDQSFRRLIEMVIRGMEEMAK
jgi:AcrR family transcriptional regulator